MQLLWRCSGPARALLLPRAEQTFPDLCRDTGRSWHANWNGTDVENNTSIVRKVINRGCKKGKRWEQIALEAERLIRIM